MLTWWIVSELLAVIAALFSFGATAVTLHDLAKISFYLEPFYNLAKLFFP